LAGAALLDVRVDAVLNECGLPSVIADTADVSLHRQVVRWEGAEMELSPMQWEIVYSRQRDTADHSNGWVNPGAGNVTCLSSDVSSLALHAKGDAGILSVKKRADNKGYLTSYQVPDSLYAAHQVIGLTGNWNQGTPVSRIQARYGNPDEILDKEDGIKLYRYWVVVKQKQMPISAQAVDFEVKGTQKICSKFTIQTKGYEFVQERLDALQRQWEKDYVLD
ncbi:MAG: hypothetical protein HZB57_05430, partial [Gammaproteobacteria bacterium]|nr:hypothetical protein [Gammaproteobacteria bacterium]